jgi:hypothetical protein
MIAEKAVMRKGLYRLHHTPLNCNFKVEGASYIINGILYQCQASFHFHSRRAALVSKVQTEESCDWGASECIPYFIFVQLAIAPHIRTYYRRWRNFHFSAPQVIIFPRDKKSIRLI